jgi:hypothetical protein
MLFCPAQSCSTTTLQFFTHVSENKLCVRLTYDVKHAHNTLTKPAMSRTHLKCSYLSVSLLPPVEVPATHHQLDAERRPIAWGSKGHVVSEIWANVYIYPHYLTADIFWVSPVSNRNKKQGEGRRWVSFGTLRRVVC